MTFKSLSRLAFVLSVIIAVSSCKKDEIEDPEIENEEEVITTLTYQLTPTAGGSDIVLTFFDSDGDGPIDPVITASSSLATNTEYSASIFLLNETESPAESINPEIVEEADDHQFFFVNDGLNLDVTYDDTDSNGNPIGLSSTVNTGDASNGALTIILRHEPDKDAAGVSDGDITNAGGESDIEATFELVIE